MSLSKFIVANMCMNGLGFWGLYSCGARREEKTETAATFLSTIFLLSVSGGGFKMTGLINYLYIKMGYENGI